ALQPLRELGRAPEDDRGRQGVVADLVAGRVAYRHLCEDVEVLVAEPIEQVADLRPGQVRHCLGKLLECPRHLRAGTRYEEAEDRGCRLLLTGRQRGQRPVDMLFDDSLRAAEALERAQPQETRVRRSL